MRRTSAWIAVLPKSKSQFYDKTLAHESRHVSDWEAKGDDGKFLYRNASKFFEDVKGKKWVEDTKPALRKKIRTRYGTWTEELANHPGDGKTGVQWQELQAYRAEYKVKPKGVRERSTKWIKKAYTNDTYR